MITAACVFVTVMSSVVLVIDELRKAPEGYEDKHGFHAVTKQIARRAGPFVGWRLLSPFALHAEPQ
jgi:hypothetical protein